jgi:hypothetical protein
MAEPDFLCFANGCFMLSDPSRSGIKSLGQKVDVRNHFEGLNDSSTATSHDVLPHSALALMKVN